MNAVICDHCGKVFKEKDTLKFVQLINNYGCFYGAHLCSRCLNKYHSFGDCAKLKEKKRGKK